MVTIAMHHCEQKKLEKEGFTWLALPYHSPPRGQSGQEPGGGADAEAMERAAYWLAPRGFPLKPMTTIQECPYPQWAGPSPVYQ